MLLVTESTLVVWPFVIIGIAVSLLLAILAGYLFNYYIIKELRNMNRNICDLTDAVGFGFVHLIDEMKQQNNKNNMNNQ